MSSDCSKWEGGRITQTLRADGYNLKTAQRSVKGTALIFKEPIDIEAMIDLQTGRVQKVHPLGGKTVKNKIIVAPSLSYNTDLEFLIYLFSVNKCSPKAFVVIRASSNLILGAVLADIPVIYGFKDNPVDIIKTGDQVAVNFEKKSIEVKSKRS